MNLRSINDRFGDILNKTLYYQGGWLDIRVVDVVIVVGCGAFVVYAYFTKGWIAAGQVALMSAFVTMCIVWFFPSSKVMK